MQQEQTKIKNNKKDFMKTYTSKFILFQIILCATQISQSSDIATSNRSNVPTTRIRWVTSSTPQPQCPPNSPNVQHINPAWKIAALKTVYIDPSRITHAPILKPEHTDKRIACDQKTRYSLGNKLMSDGQKYKQQHSLVMPSEDVIQQIFIDMYGNDHVVTAYLMNNTKLVTDIAHKQMSKQDIDKHVTSITQKITTQFCSLIAYEQHVIQQEAPTIIKILQKIRVPLQQ